MLAMNDPNYKYEPHPVTRRIKSSFAAKRRLDSKIYSMPRTEVELEEWAKFLEVCDDECQRAWVNIHVQRAALKLENELHRLFAIEELAIKVADIIATFDFTGESKDNDDWGPENSTYYTKEAEENYWKPLQNLINKFQN